ncbi:fluoride efflux transporter CrcB [Gulosibacter faecalis]|jgi:CrcB protein|uniref:Fluoride-specific ion channel FluC n=1 Tax=Gulosibacter faecalis TaxID=272240 RepID=A0ABW5UX50_9MICO|nr:fluoride efflux transporter CrcB [Gulosibacter faecalis]
MTPLLFAGIALAGGLGSVCRLVLDGLIRARTGRRMPWGTITLNLTGSFVLGLVTGLVGAAVLPSAVQLVVGTGFLGGYTTFSTASFETVRLLQERRFGAAAANGLGVLVAAGAAAALGLWLGGLGQLG